MTDELTRRLDAARAALNAAEAKAAPKVPAVRKCPTRLNVRCPKCQHAGTVEVYLEQVRKLKCSRCGHHAPVISGQKNSHTDTSNPDGVFCTTRSPTASPYSPCIHNNRFTTPPCATTTPFGRPVDPDA